MNRLVFLLPLVACLAFAGPPKAKKPKPVKAKVTCSIGEGKDALTLPSKKKPRLTQAVTCEVLSKDQRLLGGRGLFKTRWTSFNEGKEEKKEGEERSAEPGSEERDYYYNFTLDPGRDFEECSGPIELTFRAVNAEDVTTFETKLTFEQRCED